MTRSLADRVADVRRLQEAARVVLADPNRAALVAALVESTGLSPQGVGLALDEYVELHATDDQLTRFVARAGDEDCVAVVLSANVFVGALRAIAMARAASSDVVVRPSRRDPIFARALVDALARLGDHSLRIDEAFDVASFERGEIHVYGQDATIAAIRVKAAVSVRGHGSGMGVAWVSARADLEREARALAKDVVVFDQRGCLSPRIVLVRGDAARADALADALHEALERLGATVPRGEVPTEERAAIGRYIATMTYASRAIVGAEHAIGVAADGAPLVLPPTYRTVHVAACTSPGEAARLLAPLAKGIVTVGSDDAVEAALLAPAGIRLSALGSMQRPPLDGPVDLRAGAT